MKLDVYDVLGAVAIGLIAYGSWLIYPPAAFIAPGLVFLIFALVGSVAKYKHRHS